MIGTILRDKMGVVTGANGGSYWCKRKKAHNYEVFQGSKISVLVNPEKPSGFCCNYRFFVHSQHIVILEKIFFRNFHNLYILFLYRNTFTKQKAPDFSRAFKRVGL